MFKHWFHRKDAAAPSAIQERLCHIEQALQRMNDQQGVKNHIHIDTLHVHDPVLEKLEFRLQNLDIDELSGALNLGNNFGVRVNPKLSIKRDQRQSPADGTKAAGAEPNVDEGNGEGSTMDKTQSGFTFRFPQ
ncbi:hypothetical protein [Alicyclobacillus dauci]|uniref:Uncharacterized protein n=1 Tax=Alicyclobacillus dauci TaxID=1475485 RepID=A0ABY6Z2X8_9BACL|nr:hypothetical protein [Alicyclobacillus dauci]WAH37230.1 hypothetical protein NZD86_01385 [Alicyclobacillus dauci]